MAVAALIIAALYFGREIFVPVVLSVLLSFVLAPFVMRLHSWRVPRTVSVLVVVFIGFSIIFSLGGLMVSQATRLAGKLPGYQQTLSDKIESLRGLMGGSRTLEQASTVSRCHWAPCRSSQVPRYHARRPASADAAPTGLPTNAGRRSYRSGGT